MDLRRDVFQAIADPTRRAILALVALQATTPGVIAQNFPSSRQTISRHIQILTECELLKQTQAGREIRYQLNPHKVKEVADWLEPYRQIWEDRLSEMDALLNEIQTTKTGSEK